jgi:hypothetical protein
MIAPPGYPKIVSTPSAINPSSKAAEPVISTVFFGSVIGSFCAVSMLFDISCQLSAISFDIRLINALSVGFYL